MLCSEQLTACFRCLGVRKAFPNVVTPRRWSVIGLSFYRFSASTMLCIAQESTEMQRYHTLSMGPRRDIS